jgi:hypothetical protein
VKLVVYRRLHNLLHLHSKVDVIICVPIIAAMLEPMTEIDIDAMKGCLDMFVVQESIFDPVQTDVVQLNLEMMTLT